MFVGMLESGPLAQSVEQRTFNPWVVGSIPTGPTHFITQSLNSQVDPFNDHMAFPICPFCPLFATNSHLIRRRGKRRRRSTL